MSYKNTIDAYGQTKLAKELDIPSSQVHHWVQGIRGVPPKYCKKIVSLMPSLSVQILRPDDWFMHWPELAEPKIQIAVTEKSD